jgi:indoleacetamide hydrolase
VPGGRAGAEQRIGAPVMGSEVPRALAVYLAEFVPGTTLTDLHDGITNGAVRQVLGDMLDGPGSGRGARDVLALDRDASLAGIAALRRAERRLFEDRSLDAVVFPTTPAPAAPLTGGELVDVAGRTMSCFDAYTRLTAHGSLVGAPGLTLPIPVAAGERPVGLALDGVPGGDEALLAVGAAVEHVLR